MKKLALVSLLALGLAASAQAVIVGGASVGYLVDGERPMYSARVGTIVAETDSLAQIGEFEIGFVSDKEGPAKIRLMPLMLNYRADFKAADTVGYYAGAGAGLTSSRIKVLGLSDDDWAFSAQAFAGITLKEGERFKATLGARYIWIGEAEHFGVEDKIGDDVSIELGFSWKF